MRLGGHGEWQLALRSDGSAVVTRLEENEAGGSAGVGVSFSPAGLDASASVTLTAGYRSGRAWRFDGAAAARAFLDGARRDADVSAGARRPTSAGTPSRAPPAREAGAALAGLAELGVEARRDAVLGLRRDGAARTVTRRHRQSTRRPRRWTLPGFPATPAARRAVVAEVTWAGDGVRELALRTASRAGDRLEEVTARLDLRDPASRALAERLLRPGDEAADLRALGARIATHGSVERDGYAVTEDRRGFSVAGRLGVALGLAHERVTAERRLTDAVGLGARRRAAAALRLPRRLSIRCLRDRRRAIGTRR